MPVGTKSTKPKFVELTVDDLATLGMTNDAITNLLGRLNVDGAENTFVLSVKEDADFEQYMRVQGLLEIGDRGAESGYGYSGSEYPGPEAGKEGCTISEDGVVRSDGFISLAHENGLVLKSVDGHYYSFRVAPGGNLNLVGVDMGVDEV